jgi:DNA mismatch repair protein MSH5
MLIVPWDSLPRYIHYKLSKPQIVEDLMLIIKNGRHLSEELTVDSFVSNDTCMTMESNIALITGPNSSGKAFI